MKIEVLFIEECPNYRLAVEEVNRILQLEGVPAQVEEIMVSDTDSAEQLRFLGSPTIRIDGVDVEPAARSSRDYAFACRTYQAAGRSAGVPTEAVIRQAIREAGAKCERPKD